MLMGDFAGTISTCEPLLNSLPKRSEMRMEILQMPGLAHGMLKQYQQSYDVFSEAIDIDPTVAESWYNRGLARSLIIGAAIGKKCVASQVAGVIAVQKQSDTTDIALRISQTPHGDYCAYLPDSCFWISPTKPVARPEQYRHRHQKRDTRHPATRRSPLRLRSDQLPVA